MFSDWTDRLFNKHKFVRRYLILWASIMDSMLIAWMMFNPELVTGPVSNVIIAVNGLISVTGVMYFKAREKD